ncbi:hypothetical protein EON67_10395 [archaeon]|nr:MAG: hypothetical protein EON67_10395 [archaeon]
MRSITSRPPARACALRAGVQQKNKKWAPAVRSRTGGGTCLLPPPPLPRRSVQFTRDERAHLP